MRTTITIAEELYREVKASAARSGRTVSRLIEDAVRAELNPATTHEPVPELPVFGGGGVMPGVDLADPGALRDLMDQDGAAGARR